MSVYLLPILNHIKDNEDIQFYNMIYEFEILFRNVSEAVSDKIQRCIYSNKGSLDDSYSDLMEVYTDLLKMERRRTVTGYENNKRKREECDE